MINRRTFLKLAGAGLISLLLPQINIEAEMQLEDVFAKLANQARLTPEELDFLRIQARETQQRNSQVGGWTSADGNPRFNKPFANDMDFQVIPLGSVFFDGLTSGQQIIPNSTQTVVGNGTAVDINITTNKWVTVSADTQRIYLDRLPYRLLFYGQASFADNATGYRSLRIYQYNGGVETGFEVISRVAPSPSNNTVFSWIVSRKINGNVDIGDYFSFKVYQNSGGDLALQSFNFGLFAIA